MTIWKPVAGLLLIGLMAACGGDVAPEEPRPSSIAIAPETATLTHVTQTMEFTATVWDQYRNTMSVPVTWSTADPSVFTVDPNGVVTASGSGTTELTAAVEGVQDTAIVTVAQRVDKLVRVSGDEQEGERLKPLTDPLVLRAADEGGVGVPGIQITFRPGAESGSVDPVMVETDADGLASTEWTLGPKRRQWVSVAGPDELRNVFSATAVAPYPIADLRLAGPLVFSRRRPGTLETVEIEASVANVGDGASPANFPVRFTVDEVAYASFEMEQLEPGDSAKLKFPAGPFEHGIRMIAAEIDPDGEIEEWEKEKNRTDTTLVVGRQEVIEVGAELTLSSGTADEEILFQLDIPEASNQVLSVTLAGGVGDADLFVHHSDVRPGHRNYYRCIRYDTGNQELCQHQPTRAGSYHIVVYTFQPYSRAKLKVTVGEEPADTFDIDLQYVKNGTATQERIIAEAAKRWESIIPIGEPDVSFIRSPASAGNCGPGSPGFEDVVDDLRVFVSIDSIDGAGGSVANSWTCYARTVPVPEWEIPGTAVAGWVRLDEADIDDLVAGGTFGTVVAHELGHVLGFGTIWDHYDLLGNPSVPDAPDADTHFSGALTVAAFDAAGGAGYVGGAKVPVENGGVFGLADAHWRAAVFGDELMVPVVTHGTQPLSAITIESCADMGYQVDLSRADDYRLGTGGGARRVGPRGPAPYLGDDVVRGPIRVVDRKGRVVRVYEARR